MVTIIGAGPAGCYVGALLASKGHKVSIYEEHNKIGEPVQCTGHVTNQINSLVKLKKEAITNRTKGIIVNSPNRSSIKVPMDEVILDRAKFDQMLAENAVDEGCKIFLGSRYIGGTGGREVRVDGKRKRIEDSVIIGADGPLSMVARNFGIYRKRRFMTGMQVRARFRCESDFYKVYFGRRYGLFSWVVPEDSDICKIGTLGYKDVSQDFSGFLKELGVKQIIDKQNGLIPIYDPQNVNQNIFDNTKVYLIGDAAGQVKATTGGGIVQGLTAARELAKAIDSKKDYEKLWKGVLGKELWLHIMIRKVLDRFKDKDYDYLINLMNGRRVKKILSENNRDYPSKMMLKLLVNEPRFFYFLKLMV
ncbi:NAD(P)/FAD-dependent oxidoreductase [Candidatus Woesearchaeota archaeon]|nr:NAD(P)/FAD-dependent oxidoreductase [Candidatus Woesearchaeota archaeon]